MSIRRPIGVEASDRHYMLTIYEGMLLYCRDMDMNEHSLGGCMTREEKIREAGELHLELQDLECERQILQATADKIVRALEEVVKHHHNKDHGDALQHVLQNIPPGDHALQDVFLKLGTVKARIAEIRRKLKI